MKVQAKKLVRTGALAMAIGIVLLSTGTQAGSEQRGTQSPPDQRQSQMPSLSSDPGLRRGVTDPNADAMSAKMGDQQARSRNADRQNRLEVDTKKLLALATELKEQVDKTDKNVLSIDVIKKADEIERLAKSVKERMKG
jgi:hypothetical protein